MAVVMMVAAVTAMVTETLAVVVIVTAMAAMATATAAVAAIVNGMVAVATAMALVADMVTLILSRTKKSYNQNLLYREMLTSSGSNLVLCVPNIFYSYTCNNIY